ncbi:MAG: hypothetical protein ABJB11_21270 [Ferruginibacter sp.]
MSHYRLLILIIFLLVSQIGKAQQEASASTVYYETWQKETPANLYLNIGDSVFIIKGVCKNNLIVILKSVYLKPLHIAPKSVDEIPLFKIHGNVLYNFSYRSYLDTPFAQTDLMQHLVQTNLNFVIKDKYPVKMTINNRSSNSSYFKNLTDVNIQFDQRSLLNNIKGELMTKAIKMVKLDQLQKIEGEFASQQLALQQLQQWISNPARMQEIVNEKERALENKIIEEKLKKITSLKSDTSRAEFAQTEKFELPPTQNLGFLNSKFKFQKGINIADASRSSSSSALKQKDSSYIEKYNKRKEDFEKLKNKVRTTESKLRETKKKIEDSISRIKQQVNAIKSTDSLYSFMNKNGIDKSELTKAQKVLLSVKKVGIGRNELDYSELTVKNISLSGLSVELNPNRLYLAFAAGKVNYRFRDFIYKNTNTSPGQHLYLVRAGIGKIEKSNIIATLYNGTKSVLNYSPGTLNSPLQKVMGISIEGKMSINENNYIIAEIAKSSYVGNSSTQPSSAQLMNKVFDWKTRTNEAYSIKLFSQNPSTGTRITGYYKKLGANFQSFNLYPVNTNQDAWMIRGNQTIWKKRIVLDAAIRKNDFVSPFLTQSFSNQSIFKSFQATLRIPKYPFVSIGYYPSSQLTLSNNNLLIESQYNTFNTIVSHSYNINKIAMNSNAVFTKFYNNSSDTGFIYFNASSLTFNHAIYLSPFNLQTTVAITHQQKLQLFTLEEQVNWQVNKYLSVTGGAKWNRLNKSENLFGAIAAINMVIKGFGTLQFNYEKTYLPGISRILLPVDMGRMSFYKEF